jgi:hypothetical protein
MIDLPMLILLAQLQAPWCFQSVNSDPDCGYNSFQECRAGMGTLLFTCPNTGRRVQGLLSEEADDADENTYHMIECLACGQVHLIGPVTGRVLRPSED